MVFTLFEAFLQGNRCVAFAETARLCILWLVLETYVLDRLWTIFWSWPSLSEDDSNGLGFFPVMHRMVYTRLMARRRALMPFWSMSEKNWHGLWQSDSLLDEVQEFGGRIHAWWGLCRSLRTLWKSLGQLGKRLVALWTIWNDRRMAQKLSKFSRWSISFKRVFPGLSDLLKSFPPLRMSSWMPRFRFKGHHERNRYEVWQGSSIHIKFIWFDDAPLLHDGILSLAHTILTGLHDTRDPWSGLNTFSTDFRHP